MPEHSIEFLGQKFSYPSTWQGAFSILVVCASITIAAITLSPEQIESIGVVFGKDADKQFESELLKINEQLSQENQWLKQDMLQLTEAANISDREKRQIVAKIEKAEEEISNAYAGVIEKQIERKQVLSAAIPSASIQNKQMLNIEEARILERIGQLKRQQPVK